MTQVRLRNKHDRRVRAGHPWVFSNEIDGDVASLPVGGVVDVVDAKGAWLGRGFSHPGALLAVRIVTRNRDESPDDLGFWESRLRRALALRTALWPDRRSYRLVYAEGDGLGGLIVDRYDNVLVAQLNTTGVDIRRDLVAKALQNVVAPAGALLRNDGHSRRFEGLADEVAVWFGAVPETVDIDEYGTRLRVDLRVGQKTGHFFDHADNRRFFAPLCAGRSVLDVFSHTGAWGLAALRAGAASALLVDRSESALDGAVTNASLNDLTVQTRVGDAREVLNSLGLEGRLFGAIVVDPPAFARSRNTAGAALRGYRQVNAAALRLLEPGGFFATASCSHHVEEQRFLETICDAATDAGRSLTLLRRGEQAPDHPMPPQVPETRYLKCFVFRVEGGP